MIHYIKLTYNLFVSFSFQEHTLLQKCESLYKLDYSLIEIDNINGCLSPRYPGRIFIPEYEHGHMAATITSTSAFTNGYHCTTTSQTITPAVTTTTPSTTIFNGFLHNSNGSCYSNNSISSNTTSNGIHAYVTFANQCNMPQPMQQSQPPPPPLPHPQEQSQLQQQQQQQHTTIYEDLSDINKIRELVTLAKYARCRQRFAVPVIMYKGKYICRSATISVMPETYGRKVVDYAYDCLNGTNNYVTTNMDDENNDPTDESLINTINEPSPFSYDEVIKSDIQLLNALNVSTIVDLMVEKRKIKYFMA